MSRLTDLHADLNKTRTDLVAADSQYNKLLAQVGVDPDAAGDAQLTALESRRSRLKRNAERLEGLVESAAAADRESNRAAAEKASEAARAKLIAKLNGAVEDAAALDKAAEAFVEACKAFQRGGVERHALAAEIMNSRLTGSSNAEMEVHALQAGLVIQPASGKSGNMTHSLAGLYYTIAESLGLTGLIDNYWVPRGATISRSSATSHHNSFTPFADAAAQDVAMITARI